MLKAKRKIKTPKRRKTKSSKTRSPWTTPTTKAASSPPSSKTATSSSPTKSKKNSESNPVTKSNNNTYNNQKNLQERLQRKSSVIPLLLTLSSNNSLKSRSWLGITLSKSRLQLIRIGKRRINSLIRSCRVCRVLMIRAMWRLLLSLVMSRAIKSWSSRSRISLWSIVCLRINIRVLCRSHRFRFRRSNLL